MACKILDDRRKSHIAMKYRAVIENVDAVSDCLRAAWRGCIQLLSLSVAHRKSASWGQLWLTA